MWTRASKMLQYGWQDQLNISEAIRGPYKILYKQVLNWHRSGDGEASVWARIQASATK